MSKFELLSFSGAEELADATAARWLEELRGATAPYCVALSGGRIAGHFFDSAARLARPRPAVFDQVHFFWGDERCVPPTDPESNFRLAQERLLTPLGIAQDQLHRIRGEAEPQQAATEAERELRRFAPSDRDGQPVLDLVFLGMGEEGHIASLFPGETEAVRAAPAVFRHVLTSKPPPRRITLGYPALAAAREVWLLASGAGKEAALRAAIAGGSQTPVGLLLQMRQRTRIFTDIV